MSGRSDNVAQNEEGSASNGDIAAAKQIRERADEWADGAERKQIAQDEPGPAINAADVSVNCAGSQKTKFCRTRAEANILYGGMPP